MTEPLQALTGALWGATASMLLFVTYFLFRIFKAQLSMGGQWLWLRFTPSGRREAARRTRSWEAFVAWCETDAAKEAAQRIAQFGQWGVSVRDLYPEEGTR